MSLSDVTFRHRRLGRSLACAILGWFALTMAALSDTPILSAPEAEAKLQSGEIVLIDIRSRGEWQDTGVAEGAWPVSMHEPDFGERFRAILDQVSPDKIALICATGGRTAHVVQMLRQAGIEGVADVSEGMMGNPRGAGWIARGQSVVSLDAATATYEDAQAKW